MILTIIAALGGLIATAFAAAPSFAQDTLPLGGYTGASAGHSAARIDDERITANLLGSGFSSSSIVDDNRSSAFKVFGGYQLTPNFALEGGYFDLGRFGYTATAVPSGTLTGELKARGLNLDLVGTVPLTDRLSGFARAGVTYMQTRDAFSGTGAVMVNNPSPRANGANFKVGVGLQYALSERLGLRAEVERYRVNDAIGNRGDIDTALVGLIYRFGDASPASRAATPVFFAPAPFVPPAPVVAPAPVAPPVLLEPVRAPVSQRVTLASDALFDFDKSVLKPESKTQLDGLLSKMQGMNLEVAVAVGHTDSVGHANYNQHLSMRRAVAVKAYLASKNVDASRIYTEGKGATMPVADNGTVAGREKNRRVEVEVVGTLTK